MARFADGLPQFFTRARARREAPRLGVDWRHQSVEAAIDEGLRDLEENGFIRRVGDGWIRVDEQGVPCVDELPLQRGQIVKRGDLAVILGYDGLASLRRGIVTLADNRPFRRHILVFHDPFLNPYGDHVGTDRVRYIGQGKEGDQKMERQNKALANHLQDGKRVHFFEKQDRQGNFQYRGQVVVESWEWAYRPAEGRSVIEFTLLPAATPEDVDAVDSALDAYADALTTHGRPPPPPYFEERTRPVRLVERAARDRWFRDALMSLYEHQCAVCGEPLRGEDVYDLQGAHILAFSRQGPDELNNGLCLCARHHWAFDHGIFSLDMRRRVLYLSPHKDPHRELESGMELHLPEDEVWQPHPGYLELHRGRWPGARVAA